MEQLKRLLNQFQGQLSGMGLSQRLVIALCTVVLVGASVWLLQWSGKPELVPMLNQAFNPEELAAAQHRLELAGVRFEIKDDKLWVPAKDRPRLIALLKESDALPSDIGTGFDELIDEASPWLPEKERAFQRMVARGNELSRVVRNFGGVKNARVIIGAATQAGFRRNGSPITATVTLWLKPSFEPSKRFLNMVASTIAGATPGLAVTNVHVIDATNGTAFRASDGQELASGELFERKLQHEKHYADKVSQQLSFIPGVIVGVFAEISYDTQRSEARKVDRPVVTRETTEETRQSQSSGGGEPGLVPNVGTALAVENSEQSSSSKKSETDYAGFPSEEILVTLKDKGALLKLTASVSVPNSYFINVFKESHKQDPESDADLEPIRTKELERIRKTVAPLIAAADDSQVHVEWFYDQPQPLLAMETEAPDFVGNALGSYGKPAGLAGLALISLVVMLRMVRRAPSAPPVAHADNEMLTSRGRQRPVRMPGQAADGSAESTTPVVLSADLPTIGDAAATSGVLEGKEVDEETIKVQQMSAQVARMVKDDTAAAARLLQRWVDRR